MNYKKLNFYICFVLIFIFIYNNILSSPLEHIDSEFDNPFLLYNNPSLVINQNGAPFGFSMFYNPEKNYQNINIGISQTFPKASFSLAYLKKNINSFNKLSTSFSTYLYKGLSFGSAVHFFLIDMDLIFTFDAALSYHFKKKFALGIIFNNINVRPNYNKYLFKNVAISASGKILKIKKFYYFTKFITEIYNLPNYSFGFGGDISVQKHFFNNPGLSIFLRSNIIFDKKVMSKYEFEGVAGYHAYFSRFSFGLYLGYIHNKNNEESSINTSFYINPLNRRKISQLSGNIELSSYEINTEKYSFEDNIVISITGVFKSEKAGIKRWSLLIYEDSNTSDNIVRTFNGGNIPPSSILWDGRDSQGNLLKNGFYKIKIVLIDSINRVVSSSYKTIKIY